MKSKLLTLFAGAVTLSLSVASVVPVFAQSTTLAQQQGHHRHYKNRLNLTADQQAQIKKIRQDEQTAINNILTTDQKAQLKAERQARRGQARDQKQPGMHRDPFASLNLTPDQRSRIEAVHQTAKQQIDAVLTSEQRQQKQQFRQQHQQRQQQQ
jgi:protein CpxP